MKAAMILPPGTAFLFATVVFFLGSFCPARTQDTNPAPIPPGMVTMNLKLGIADLESVKQALPDLLSPDAPDPQILEQIRMLRITDRPENIEAVRKLIEALSVPVPNVRLTVTSKSVGGSTAQGFGVRGGGTFNTPRGTGGVIVNPPPGATPGVIRQPTINGRPLTNSGGRIVLPGGGVEIGGTHQVSGSDALVSQSLLVRSGGTGVLEVVREVPMVDFFTRLNVTSYLPVVIRGPNRQVVTLLPGGTFEVPEFRWEKAGSELMVKPIVHGNLITVTVVPRISAVVIANPQAFRERRINSYLTGADQYVEYSGLATEVTIANGATLTIGGFSKAAPEFNRNFWGYGNRQSATAGTITLKATIEPPAKPPGQ